jgi:hypothetical protein
MNIGSNGRRDASETVNTLAAEVALCEIASDTMPLRTNWGPNKVSRLTYEAVHSQRC